MLAKGSGRKGKNQRGGFISYAQLGINQLGAVYEGLMSYTGFIAAEELYEVAKKGDPSGGSWMIPASKVPFYGDDVFVKEKDENGFPTGERVRYRPGSFVYRLAGRDRQTSASYYTPQSLTSVTVQLALEQRIKEEGRPVSAAEVLRWRVCEPALGSGAFLNEAIDQLAALYLRLREEETGDRLEPDERALALQKIKAYIALHNCYGVDLNETAVELAEVSIWLNVMHRGLQAPWFGLHLVRGNSLIGAGRRLYPAHAADQGGVAGHRAEDHPFSAGPIPSGHVHHFLLPAKGWGAVADEKEAKELAPDQAKQLAPGAGTPQAPVAQEVSRSQAHPGPAPAGPVGPRRVPVVPGHRAPSDLRARDQPNDRRLGRGRPSRGRRGDPARRDRRRPDRARHPVLAPEDRHGRLVRPVVLAARPGGPARRLARGLHTTAAPEPEPEPPVDPDPAFPTVWEMDSLFGETPKQLTLAEAAPRKPRPKPAPADHPPRVPLRDLDDWLDFAEAVLGRQDVAPDSLASHFTSLSDMEEYEDKLESDFYMDMDPVWRLAERFPWLDTVEQIAARPRLLPLGTPLRLSLRRRWLRHPGR